MRPSVMLLAFVMRSICLAFAAFCLMSAPGVRAQEQTPPAGPAVLIRLPGCADTKNLEIHYRLVGPFGAYRGPVRAKEGASVYRIDASYEGQPARSLRAVIYCPGYQAETLDYPSLVSPRERSPELRLKPLGTVPFAGQVSLPAGVEADEVNVEVGFSALWECEFFGEADCLVPSYRKVASAEVADGGVFSVALPDFADDPIISKYGRPGYFTFTVSERRSGKYLFSIRPEAGTDANGGLPVAPLYQGVQTFVPDGKK